MKAIASAIVLFSGATLFVGGVSASAIVYSSPTHADFGAGNIAMGVGGFVMILGLVFLLVALVKDPA
jgi:hypothetical protein